MDLFAELPLQSWMLRNVAEYKRRLCEDMAGPEVPPIFYELLLHARSLAHGDNPDYVRFQEGFRQLSNAGHG